MVRTGCQPGLPISTLRVGEIIRRLPYRFKVKALRPLLGGIAVRVGRSAALSGLFPAGWRIYEGGGGVKGFLFCVFHFFGNRPSPGRGKCGKPAFWAGFPSAGGKSVWASFPRRVISTALILAPFNG